jgi:hypothetical protein
MNRLQKFCLLGVFSLETMSFHEAAQAQITPYLGKPHQIRPDLYRKQNDGTILETKTGDTYDMKGNLLKPAPRFRSPNSSPSPSRTYRLDRKDLFTFTNQADPNVTTGQYANFGGTFSGKYTLPFWASLGFPIKGTLDLTQTGNQVTGTLVTGNGREAEFQGVVQGSQLVGKLIFNDRCAGEGSLIGDLSPTGDLMTGKYKVSDCNGKYSGRHKLKRI